MTIAETAEKFGLTADTLRYYEKVGLIPHIKRTSGGIRDYSEEDFKWIDFTKCMRAAGLEISVLAKYYELFQKGDSTKKARKQILIEQRNILQTRIDKELETLKRLNFKIENYDNIISKAENGLK